MWCLPFRGRLMWSKKHLFGSGRLARYKVHIFDLYEFSINRSLNRGYLDWNLILIVSADDWSSSSIFEKSLRRGSDESTTSIQTTIAEEQEGFDDASAPSGQTGGNFQQQSKVVVIRKKQRKPAARSYSMLADQRQRPLSMSCVQIHPSPRWVQNGHSCYSNRRLIRIPELLRSPE